MLRSRLTVEHLRKSSRLSLLSHDSQLVIGLVREYRSSLQGVAFSRQTEPRSSGDLACCCCSGRPRKGGGSARLGNARREKGRQRARARQRSRSFAAPRFRTDEGEDLVNINIKKKRSKRWLFFVISWRYTSQCNCARCLVYLRTDVDVAGTGRLPLPDKLYTICWVNGFEEWTVSLCTILCLGHIHCIGQYGHVGMV
jgi:hypothetical protein